MASDNDVAAKLAFLFALCSLYSQILCSSKISNLRLCGSRDCEEIISYARAVRPLRSNDPAFLSFEEGDTIYIYSKSAGRKPYLWGGQVNGLRGYFPMSFVKEYQVLIKNPLSVVITENYQLEKPVVTMEEKDETDLEEEEENDVFSDEADDIKITELNTVTKTEKKDLVNEPKSTVDTTDIDSDVDGKLEVKNSLVSTKPPNEDSEIQDETDFEETAIKVDVETERDAASESENQELNKALHEKSKETKDAAAASVDKRIEELTQSFHHFYLEKNARKSDNLINEAESTNGNANSAVNGELENPPEEKNSKKIASNGNMDVTTDSKMKSDEGEKDADEKSVEKMDITAIEKKISEENKTDEKLKIEAPNRQVDGMQQQQSKIDEIKLSKKYGMREESFYNGDVDAVKAGEISQDVVGREPLPVNDEEEFQTKQELKTPVTFSGLSSSSSSSLASLELQSTKPTLLDTSITISEKEESAKTLSTVNLTPTSTNIHSTQMLDITPTQTKGSEQLTHPQDIVRMTSAVITSDNIASDASHLEKTKTETPDQSVTVIDGTSLPLFDYNVAKEMELRISSSELLSELSTEIQSSKPVLSVAKESTNSHVNTKSTETAEQHTRVQDNVYLSSSLPEHESFFFTAKNKNITDEVSTGRIMPTVPPTEKPINTYTSSEFMSRKTLSYRSSTTFSTGNSQEKPDQEASDLDKNSEKANAEETLQKPEYEEKHTADIPVHHESSVTNAKSFKEGDRADTKTSPKVAQNIEIPNPLIHTAAADDNTKSNSDPAHTGEGSKTRAEKEVYTSTFQHNMKWLLAKLDFCLKVIGEKLPSSVRSLLEHEPFGIPHSVSIVFIIASPVSMFILLTCCCNSSGEKKTKKKDPLVIIRNLEEKLFITTKEKENLEDALQNLEEKFCDQEQLKHQEQSLETDLNRQKLQYVALQKKHLDQEKELEKFKKQDEERKQLEKRKDKEISELEEKVLSQQDELLKLNENSQKANQNLNTKSEELTTLKSQVTTMNDQIHHLEIRKQQLLDELEDWNEKSKEMSDNLQQTQCEYKQMQDALAFKDNEMEVLKECIMQLKSLDDESSQPIVGDHVSVQEKIQAMMDVSRVNATLKAVEEEREIFHNRLQIETESRKELEDQIEYVKRELESVHTDKMKADRQCQEAQTKLSVLTNYFKEKEMEMQKELGEQEVLKKQNINKLATADEKAKMVEEELISYKQQVEDLKREILTAERDFRVQIATNEKKAHENWLATRAAERELKESRNQLGTLRQKLTSMDNRPFPGPAGLIRPLATRNLPPPGIMNGPPGSERFLLPHPADRPPFKGLVLHGPPPRMEDFRGSPIPDRIAPLDRRSLPPGVKMSPSPPHRGGPPPPPPPPPPPFDRRAPMDRRLPVGPKWVPPPHPGDRRSPSSRKSPPYSPPLSNATPGSQRRAPPVRLETPPSNRIDPSLRQGPHGSAFGRPPSPTASPQGRERPPRQHSQV